MSLFGSVGKKLGSVGKTVSGGGSNLGKSAVGYAVGGPLGALAAPAVSGGLPGIQNALTGVAPKVGLGTYKADQYQPNINDFQNNPQYAQEISSLQNQLGTTNARTPTQVSAVPAQTAQATAAQLDANNFNQTRGQAETLIGQLQGQANGTGPSLAQGQLQAGRDANIATAMALGASQRGLTAGQGLRNISDQTLAANQQTAQQAAQLRLQEQIAAQQQLGGVLGQTGSQDLNLANANANYQQGVNLANMAAANSMNQFNSNQGYQSQLANQNANLYQTNLNDQMNRFYNQGILGTYQNQQNAGMAYNQLGAGIQNAANQVNMPAFNSGQQRVGNAWSALGQGILGGINSGALGGLGGSAGGGAASGAAPGGWAGADMAGAGGIASMGALGLYGQPGQQLGSYGSNSYQGNYGSNPYQYGSLGLS